MFLPVLAKQFVTIPLHSTPNAGLVTSKVPLQRPFDVTAYGTLAPSCLELGQTAASERKLSFRDTYGIRPMVCGRCGAPSGQPEITKLESERGWSFGEPPILQHNGVCESWSPVWAAIYFDVRIQVKAFHKKPFFFSFDLIILEFKLKQLVHWQFKRTIPTLEDEIILSISPGFTTTSLTNIIRVPCSGN